MTNERSAGGAPADRSDGERTPATDEERTGTVERIEAKLDEWARMACPAGHVNLEDQVGPSVYCPACGSAYGYEDLLDKRTGRSGTGRS